MIKSKLISKATFYNKSGNKDIASFTEVASMNQTHSNVVLEIERSGVYDADALITTKKHKTHTQKQKQKKQHKIDTTKKTTTAKTQNKTINYTS